MNFAQSRLNFFQIKYIINFFFILKNYYSVLKNYLKILIFVIFNQNKFNYINC